MKIAIGNDHAAVALKHEIVKYLEEKGIGGAKTNFKLRDWLISRQRYWGAPIPVIHCPHCGAVPVPEDQLPVELPYDVEFKPDGTSPLLKHEGFMNTKCPVCGADAKRDPDTLDTFVCSSWYYLRYPDNKNADKPFDKEIIDQYVNAFKKVCANYKELLADDQGDPEKLGGWHFFKHTAKKD